MCEADASKAVRGDENAVFLDIHGIAVSSPRCQLPAVSSRL